VRPPGGALITRTAPPRPFPRYLEVSLRPTSFNGRVPARFPWKDEFMDLLIRLREWGPPKGGPTNDPDPADRLAAEGVGGRPDSTAKCPRGSIK